MSVLRRMMRVSNRSLLAFIFFFSLSSSCLYFIYVAPGIGKYRDTPSPPTVTTEKMPNVKDVTCGIWRLCKRGPQKAFYLHCYFRRVKLPAGMALLREFC